MVSHRIRLYFFIRLQTLGAKGVTVFLVLWVLVLLSVIVGEFCRTMKTEINITRNMKQKAEAYYIALAGMNVAVHELVITKGFPPTGKADIDMPTDERPVWRINAEIPPFEYGNGQFKVWVENESGRLNLNVVERPLLVAILKKFDLDEDRVDTIADSILDWRDADSFHRLHGAEDDYYQSLPDPYPCKDALFESVAELQRVKGVDRALYDAKLESVFTVYAAPEPNASGKKAKMSTEDNAEIQKVNINAADRNVLLALPGISEEMADAILEYRTDSDIMSLAELQDLIGGDAYGAVRPYLTTRPSQYFTIHSVGRIKNSHAEHYMKAMIVLNTASDEKYRILTWWDQAPS